MTISCNALLDRVVICGSGKLGGLWIKPMESVDPVAARSIHEKVAKMSFDVKVMIDISQYDGGELEILGLPEEKILIDPAKHIVIRRSKNRIDWDALSIPNHSLWRIRYSRLDDFKVDVGVYDIPKVGEDDEALAELELLRDAGIFG
jgi:hypothetical protein